MSDEIKILKREDFQLEPSLKYYFFKDKDFPIEINFEPCFNGFDVALYRSDEGPWLLRDKECTNEEGYGGKDFIVREIQIGLQERRLETWEHALKIANKFYSSFLSYAKVRKLKLMPDEVEGETDVMLKKVEDKSKIHSVNPRGRI